jgi:hypothetical protein
MYRWPWATGGRLIKRLQAGRLASLRARRQLLRRDRRSVSHGCNGISPTRDKSACVALQGRLIAPGRSARHRGSRRLQLACNKRSSCRGSRRWQLAWRARSAAQNGALRTPKNNAEHNAERNAERSAKHDAKNGRNCYCEAWTMPRGTHHHEHVRGQHRAWLGNRSTRMAWRYR